MIIGICGKSGCGKTTLANNLIKQINKECIHLDIDKVGHNVLLLPEVKEELIKSFGKNIADNNIVNRKKLGDIVFNSHKEMKKLTDITWLNMQIIIDDFLKQNKDKVIILDWLLLPKSKYFDMCDIKILLDVPYEIRLKRAMERDNITEEVFALREKASYEYDKNNFDFIVNSNDEDIIKEWVMKI